MATEYDAASKKIQKVIFGIVGTIFLGALGSGLWEVLFRPGISSVGLFLISISNYADKSIYTTAALDPTPVPGLIVLMTLTAFPASAAGFFIMKGIFEPKIKNKIFQKISQHIKSEGENYDHEEHLKTLEKRVSYLSVAAAIVQLFFFFVFLYAFSVENSAVRTWRVYHKNLDIISPYIDDKKIKILNADFRSMNGRSDFIKIKKEIDSIASKQNIEISWYE